MRLLGTFPMLALALVIFSIVSLCLAQQSILLLVVAGVLAAMSWYVTEGPRGRALPRWTTNILIVAVCVGVLVDLAQHRQDILGVLGRFLVWLTLIKLYQRKAPRDYAQLLSLSLLLMLLGCSQSDDLLLGAALLVYAVFGLYVLLLFQLYASYEKTRTARLGAIPAGYRLGPSLAPVFGRRPELHFRTLTAGIAGVGLLTSAILFMIFPRDVGRGLISPAPGSSIRRAGFTDEVNLATSTRITDSRKVVMSVRLAETPPHAQRPLRLRGAVLDRYEDGRWTATRSDRDRLIESGPPGFVRLGATAGDTGPPITHPITQEFDVLTPSPTLFSVYVPVSIATRDARRIRFDPINQVLELTESGHLQRYAVKAQPAPTEATLAALTGGFETRPAPHFPNLDPRVGSLARDLLAAAPWPVEAPTGADDRWRWNRSAARILTEYLHSGGFVYDLDVHDIVLRAAGGPIRDPTLQFLFKTRRGHCEYFASALAVMCNSLGIPARLVTGYVALEYDEGSRRYIVRESNAHAWVEVRTGAQRWTTFDPTPPATLQRIHGAPPTLADHLRFIFDRFEARWHNGFVAFDRRAQTSMMTTLELAWSRRLSGPLTSTRRWLIRVNRAFYLGPAGYIWMGIVALAAVVAVIAISTRWRRSLRMRATLQLQHVHGREHHRMLRQLGFYLDMLTVLEKSGLPKPDWQPPLEYAAVLAEKRPEPAPLVAEITEIFYSARYGGATLGRDTVLHAQSLVRQLAAVCGIGPPVPTGS